MKKFPKFFWRALVPSSGRPQKFFQEGKNDILLVSFSFQVAEDATQIDERKKLYPFCRNKENAQCYGNSCKQGSLLENLHWVNVF